MAVFAAGVVMAAQPYAPPTEMGEIFGLRLAVSNGNINQRIGNAVLVRVQSKHDGIDLWTSEALLLACDGSWISSAIHATTAYEKDFGFAAVERMGRSEEKEVPLDTVTFSGIDDSFEVTAPVLKRRATQLCRKAGPEPRNTLVPVASATNQDGTGRSYAIVLGTITRYGPVLDVWIRRSDFTVEPLRDPKGNPITRSGTTVLQNVPTSAYSLVRSSFNCKERTYGISQSVDYANEHGASKSTSIPRVEMKLDAVIPDSVAESQLDAICRLYG